MNWLFGFQGRIGRLEWWLIQFLTTVFFGAGAVLIIYLFGGDTFNPAQLSDFGILVFWVLFLVVLWVDFACTCKRYHDRGKSGWWNLIFIIPFGILFIIIECGFFPGTDDNNPYGGRGKTTSKADLIKSVYEGNDVRPDILAARAQAKPKNGRQEVQINRPAGTGFGRRNN